ncbi:MAG: hypothetical protein RQ733_12830 [Methyloprofundus sp.]|nr:hypothetical protein [Methyloprofundus sp.]MDT8426845.1 hypothetical protein [Methyloprofundus sp.]
MMKFLKLLPLFFMLFIVACAGHKASEAPEPEELVSSAGTGTGTLNIAPVVFAKDLEVRAAIRNECQLLTKLPAFIQSYANGQYAVINLQAIQSSKDDFLAVEIVDLPKYTKNAWAGRGGQWVGVKGTLMRPGKKNVSFTASRASMGGFMGAYKGTCALLGRCTKTLGKDIAEWLKNPVNNATLGDM